MRAIRPFHKHFSVKHLQLQIFSCQQFTIARGVQLLSSRNYLLLNGLKPCRTKVIATITIHLTEEPEKQIQEGRMISCYYHQLALIMTALQEA